MIRADEGLMKLVRKNCIQQSNGSCGDFLVLEEHYSRLQADRDKYGPLEESYNAIEEWLDEEENEFTRLEKELQDDEDSLQPQPLGYFIMCL